ncbi:MAG TPA: NAD(P)H-hydrate dehydratase, partial [Armatimonadetes bacterium]|nr:NAD(P)H-hydrate dehydratase [Armatimonadota bacterium]
MDAANAAQSRSIDRRTIEEIGIPSLVLMENAGLAVVATARETLGDVVGRTIVAFCGKGNNGGDGLVVARHLHRQGARVRVLLAAPREEFSGDAEIQARIATNLGVPITQVRAADEAAELLAEADLAIDALLGTGTRGEVTGLVGDLIDLLNRSNVPAIAVDIPSGLHAGTGMPCGRCVRAHATVTFGVMKRGLALYPGAALAGKVVLAPIGIPTDAIAAEGIGVTLVEAEAARALLPRRDAWAHKGSSGSVLVVGGTAGMTGAATLAALSVLRVGGGLVRLAVPKSLNGILETKATEAITLPVAETEARSFASEGLRQLVEVADASECVAVGPGLGRHPETARAVLEWLPGVKAPLVLDADALNALADCPEVFGQLQAPAVITPHPGELSRLLGQTVAGIQADRIAAAEEAARRFGVVTVLKGAGTVIADPKGPVFINSTGNAAMASAGMGDVLTGAIAGLVAQGLPVTTAAVLGVYLHGLAGDIAADELGGPGILAGDV